MARPNLLIVTCHDLGDYLGCYGTPVPTPNVDRLAAEGALFLGHFSTSTVCSPARGALLTGCYPHTNGLMGLVHRGWELDVDACTPLPAILAQAGYRTHLFGFQHEHPDPTRLGYQEVHAAASSHVDHVVPVFAEWVRDQGGGERPFLAAVGVSEVHRLGLHPSGFRREEYEPAEPESVEVRPYLPDIPEMRRDLADFYGAIKLVDREMGRLLDALDDAGLRDDTLVVFTTDHGASFMHSKATLYDGGTKAALALRWPGGIPAGVRCQGLTSHVDVLPTLLDLLGLQCPQGVQGHSVAAVARGETEDTGRTYAFSEKNFTNYFDPQRTARSQRFRYIRRGVRSCIFDFIIPEIELCPCGFRRNRAVFEFYSARRCTEELYDLASDPGELRNLAEEADHAETLDQLRAALDAHLEATDDPFRNFHNPIHMPAETYEIVRGR
ncbi:MAG: sulfatase [Candidatus Brocadiia bacterium]